MGKCLLKKDRPADALALFYKAHKKELTKSYHLRDVGLALSALGDRDKAIAFLTKYNSALMAEYGKGSAVIIAKIEELSKLPQKQTIDLSDFDAPVPKICQGTITTYVSARGFGFIEDQSDSERVFFHIKRVKRGFEPSVGSRVKFVREVGEKGPLASKVWPASS
jgi:cold shock CspA family protein